MKNDWREDTGRKAKETVRQRIAQRAREEQDQPVAEAVGSERDLAVAIARTATRPEPLSVGDRIAIERRIDRFEARVEQHISERARVADEFYRTRMIPLETTVQRQVRLIWAVAGLAAACALVVMVLVAVHALRST